MKYPKRSQYQYAKSPYRIRNWPEYEAGLRRRGDLTVWLSDDAINSWRALPSRKPGGQRTYANIAIEAALTIRMILHLPLRQTEGFLRSLVDMLELEIPIPDHTTLSRRRRGLGETIEAEAGEVISVRAEVNSRLPIERIEIILGGEVVASKENVESMRALVFETDVPVEGSTWIAARAYSSEQLPYNGVPVMAHTSPVYIEVDGQPRSSPEDAAFLADWTDRAIEWARSEARFQFETQREEMIALFEKAKRIYLQQIPGATYE